MWSEGFEIVVGNTLHASKLLCAWVMVEWPDTVTVSRAAHLYTALVIEIPSCC